MRKYINTWLIVYMSIVLTTGIAANVVIAKNQMHPRAVAHHAHHGKKPWGKIVAKATKISTTSMTSIAAVTPPAHITHVKHTWRYLRVLATAYLVRNVQDDPRGHCPVYNNLTASGTHVRRGSVAVDTGVFPFGTHLIIPGYGYGRARDTGGWINGHHIDLAMTSCKEAHDWGAKHVVVAYEMPQHN